MYIWRYVRRSLRRRDFVSALIYRVRLRVAVNHDAQHKREGITLNTKCSEENFSIPLPLCLLEFTNIIPSTLRPLFAWFLRLWLLDVRCLSWFQSVCGCILDCSWVEVKHSLRRRADAFFGSCFTRRENIFLACEARAEKCVCSPQANV